MFHPRQIEARLSLGIVLPEEMPGIAWDALEAGHDGPAIRRMAALENPTGFETDRFLPCFMRETGLKSLSVADASTRLAYDKVREILDCRQDPLGHLTFFARLWYKADYPRELQDLGTLSDDAYISGENEPQTLQMVRDRLIEFAREYQRLHEI